MSSNPVRSTRSKVTRTRKETTYPTDDVITNKKRGNIWWTCTYCFSYGSVRLEQVKGHMRRCKAGPRKLKGRERDGFIDESMGKIRNAHYAFGNNIFFNPRDFVEGTYSKDDVMNILLQYGHSVVPEEAERTCRLQPFPVNVTGRTFNKSNGETHHPTIELHDESEIQSHMEVAEEEPEVPTFPNSCTEDMQIHEDSGKMYLVKYKTKVYHF